MQDCGVSKAECFVHSMHMIHVESFVVCIGGKMAQDVVKVLWCHSPSSLIGF